MHRGSITLRLAGALGIAVVLTQALPASAEPVSDERLRGAAKDGGNWLTHGRTYSEQRFSPLDQVNAKNVNQLELIWSYDTRTRRGLEATPLVVDGVMYATGSWSVVFAVDAKTGKELWRYDPKVPPEWGSKGCCDVVNRGVAFYQGKVFVGAFDGRLIAIDAKTGKKVWEELTIDKKFPYTITGAPRVVKGKVIIGNGGAEFGVRGYVSAYDAETGKMAWRTYTVPGDPAKGFESPALEKAAKTWTGEWWKMGGGGTVWDSMAFDPELDMLYVGTGNGSPWNKWIRSPDGGDNLYLCSILALDPDTGEIKWHYQTTPADTWDYTSTQHMILADLEIGGQKRKVIMQAPKNGYFYVIDRESGDFLSAENYVQVTWSDGVDRETGVPKIRAGADYKEKMAEVRPTPLGGHNWHPMAFNPDTGLVYIPALEIAGAYAKNPDFKPYDGGLVLNTGIDDQLFKGFNRKIAAGHLIAWDPIAQKERWRVDHPTSWNGGVLTTKGNLVFQGTADGRFVAYRAKDGKKLWEAEAPSGVIAAPITYEIDGVQYVTVPAGWGGALAILGGDAAAAAGVEGGGALLTFALKGKAEPIAKPEPPAIVADSAEGRGEFLFHENCFRCHGAAAIGGGIIPDLRKSGTYVRRNFYAIVAGGIPESAMPQFGAKLKKQDIEDLQAYIEHQAKAAGLR